MTLLRIVVLAAIVVSQGCEKPAAAPKVASAPTTPSTAAAAAPAKPIPPTQQPPPTRKNAEGLIIEDPAAQLEPVPTDVPLPPGLTVLTSSKVTHSNQENRVIYCQMPDEKDVAKIAAFFSEELPKHGWKVTPPSDKIMKGSLNIDIEKDKRGGGVGIYQKPGSAGTYVMIQIGELLPKP